MLKFVVGLMFCLAAADAQARASGIAQGGWSNLSTEQMSRFPAAVRLALKDAQNLCGGETTRVRTGFLRYLPGSEGQGSTSNTLIAPAKICSARRAGAFIDCSLRQVDACARYGEAISARLICLTKMAFRRSTLTAAEVAHFVTFGESGMARGCNEYATPCPPLRAGGSCWGWAQRLGCCAHAFGKSRRRSHAGTTRRLVTTMRSTTPRYKVKLGNHEFAFDLDNFVYGSWNG